MAQSNEYKLKRLWICYPDQTSKPILPNIRTLVSELNVYQSIETPYIRADVIINDPSEGFHDLLKGNEVLIFEIESEFKGLGKIELKLQLMLHRISDRIKSERQEVYRLEFISFDAIKNEYTRVNQVYKKKKISDIVSDLLKDKLKSKEKIDIETTDRPITFLSPNWRPFDAISWTCQHAARSKDDKQVGYLFYYSAREGYVFRSVDKMFESTIRLPQVQKFVYRQKNLGSPGETKSAPELDDIVALDYVKYNDVTKDMEQMRLGSYSGTVSGVDLLNLNKVTIEDYEIDQYFNKMSHMEKVKPYGKSKLRIDKRRTRQYLVGLPTYMFSDEGKGTSPGALTGNVVDKTLKNLVYSTLRYVSMKHFVLNIKVPGNTTISVGDCIEITVPTKDRKTGGQKVIADPVYSGKYIAASVIHKWSPERLDTMITIIRDTQWKEQFTT